MTKSDDFFTILCLGYKKDMTVVIGCRVFLYPVAKKGTDAVLGMKKIMALRAKEKV